jgi:integrase/recombinase XerD
VTLQTPIGLRDTAILSLMYRTGIRVSDVIHLELGDVDLVLQQIRIKSMGMKFVTIGDVCDKIAHYLREGRPHLARIPEETSLFINQRGKGLSRQGIWFIVKRWGKEAKLGDRISPNIIRHSLVRHLMDSGISNKVILRRLGFKSPNSLRIFDPSRGKVGDE